MAVNSQKLKDDSIAERRASPGSERERLRAGCFGLSESRLFDFWMAGIIRTAVLDEENATSFCVLSSFDC